MVKNRDTYIFTCISMGYLIVALYICFTLDGVGGGGDSINHYLISRHAYQHPELFFDHWGKPFFVLLSAPFAQLGMVGMKIFNVICTLVTMYFTFRLALYYRLQNPWLVALIIIFTPLYTALTFSGLTEPLFAAVLSVATYLVVTHRTISGTILISFLPYIRSEGLIIIVVYAAYYFVIHRWKYIPLLLTGSVFYGLVGSVFHNGNVLWVFTGIPYARMGSHYGSGNWTHYAEGLFYVMGPLLLVFLILGLIFVLIDVFEHKIRLSFGFLIASAFVVFFLAQTSFWALGIFNSMGLLRVFLAVIPLMALLILYGIDGVLSFLGPFGQKILTTVIIIGMCVIPFTKNKSGWVYQRDFINPKRASIQKMVAQVNQIKEKKSKLFYYDPEVVYSLQLDPWNAEEAEMAHDLPIANQKKGDILVWDSWFAPVEAHVELEDLHRVYPDAKFYNIENSKAITQFVVIRL